MRERRSLFQMIFGNKKQVQNYSQLQLLNGYNSVFTNFKGNIYESKVARECIDRIATHCAKLEPMHIKGNKSVHVKGDIDYMLANQPNPIMNTYDFLYKVITILYKDSNAFIFQKKNSDGMIEGFYPILGTSYEILENQNHNLFFKFQFINGKTYILPYEELIHLRKFYSTHDIYGSSSNVLNTDLDTALASSEGTKNAIKLSNSLKGILKFTNAMIDNKDVVKNRDKFVEDFLGLKSNGGIAALDAKADFHEINLKPITLDAEQMKQINENIYNFFGISEKIVKNNYNQVEWNAFYEGVIEPIAIQLSNEFTNKIFSQKAIKDGNKIIFNTNRIHYASLDSKINLIKVAASYGLLTKDDGREILDMTPLGGEEGSKILQSLNNIDSSIANKYQGGEDDGKKD